VFSGFDFSEGGFISFRLSDGWFDRVLDEITELGGEYGSLGESGSVLAAFVSDSGTKALEAWRGDVLTDNLASLCRRAGFRAARERFEDDLAAHGGGAGRLAAAYDRVLKASELVGGYMDETLAALEERGLAVRKNGAIFLPGMEGKTGEARMLRGQEGAYSSFALLLAYLRFVLSDKAFDRVVVVLSATGGGRKTECEALRHSLSRLGADAGRLEFILFGGVRLVKAGPYDPRPEELLDLCRKAAGGRFGQIHAGSEAGLDGRAGYGPGGPERRGQSGLLYSVRARPAVPSA
jgi:arginyl-tRNA synthetase